MSASNHSGLNNNGIFSQKVADEKSIEGLSPFADNLTVVDLIELSELTGDDLNSFIQDKPKLATAIFNSIYPDEKHIQPNARLKKSNLSASQWRSISRGMPQLERQYVKKFPSYNLTTIEAMLSTENLVTSAQLTKMTAKQQLAYLQAPTTDLSKLTSKQMVELCLVNFDMCSFFLGRDDLLTKFSGMQLVTISNHYANKSFGKENISEGILRVIWANKTLASRFHAAMLLKDLSSVFEIAPLNERVPVSKLYGSLSAYHITGIILHKNHQTENALLYLREGVLHGDIFAAKDLMHSGNKDDLELCLDNIADKSIFKSALDDRNTYEISREIYELIRENSFFERRKDNRFCAISSVASNGDINFSFKALQQLSAKDKTFDIAVLLAKAIVDARNNPDANIELIRLGNIENAFDDYKFVKDYIKAQYKDAYDTFTRKRVVSFYAQAPVNASTSNDIVANSINNNRL